MSRYCLVMLQTPLVAQDLALILQDLTGCVSITAEEVEVACLKLAGLGPGSLLYAFVQSDVASLRDSPLRALVERLGGRLVLLGHAAEMEAARQDAAGTEAETWPVLAQPFGAAQVAELLDGLRRHGPEAGERRGPEAGERHRPETG